MCTALRGWRSLARAMGRAGRPLPMAALTLALTSGLAATPVEAGWIKDGTRVSAVAGYQFESTVMPDGAGGAFIAWADSRGDLVSGQTDIYAQHIDADGNGLWAENGVPVCTAIDLQGETEIVADGAGGIIVVWTDQRAGSVNLDIYAQRLDGSGVPQWMADGVVVSAAANYQIDHSSVADGSGGVFVAWQDKRVDLSGDVYAQRIDGSGAALWTPGGVPVCTVAGGQYAVDASADGVGGFLVSWSDGRFVDFDIFMQRLDGAGAPLWIADGQDVSGIVATDESAPRVFSDGTGGGFVFWRDERVDAGDLYMQRVASTGSWLWNLGRPVVTAAGRQDLYEVVRDSSGAFLLTWMDDRLPANTDIYAQKVDVDAKAQWTVNGVAVSKAADSQLYPQLASDGAGGAIIVWHDLRDGLQEDLYGQRVTAAGETLWQIDGEPVCTAAESPSATGVCSDGQGGAIVVWDDLRTGDSDVLAQRIEPTHGFWGHPEPRIASVADVPGDQGGYARVSWLPSDQDRLDLATITYYSIWRATGIAARAAGGGDAPPLVTLDQVGPDFSGPALRLEASSGYFWEYVGRQDALYFTAYSLAAPTEADSTAGNDALHYFQVVAHTDSPFQVFASVPDSGYSVDNLAPAAPLALQAARSGGVDVSLLWRPSGEDEPDFRQYRVYRGDAPDVPADPAHFLAAVVDTMLTDGDADPLQAWYYRVFAEDVHGNLSDASNEASVGVATAIAGLLPPATLEVRSNVPNPVRTRTEFLVGLPAESDIDLRLFDVSGRLVARAHYLRQSRGWHALPFDARDDSGRRLASGVYLYRVRAGGEERTNKLIVGR